MLNLCLDVCGRYLLVSSTIKPSTTDTNFSRFHWMAMTTCTQPQIQRLGDESPDSPLPDVVDPVSFKGVSFDDGGVMHCAVDTSLAYSFLFPLPLLAPSTSSVLDHNPPCCKTAPHTQSQHLAIAPHDLPPLHISDMNCYLLIAFWYGS